MLRQYKEPQPSLLIFTKLNIELTTLNEIRPDSLVVQKYYSRILIGESISVFQKSSITKLEQ